MALVKQNETELHFKRNPIIDEQLKTIVPFHCTNLATAIGRYYSAFKELERSEKMLEEEYELNFAAERDEGVGEEVKEPAIRQALAWSSLLGETTSLFRERLPGVIAGAWESNK